MSEIFLGLLAVIAVAVLIDWQLRRRRNDERREREARQALDAQRAEAQRAAAQTAAAERAAAEAARAEAARAEARKAAAAREQLERLAAERAEADRVLAERALAEQVAADRAAAARAAAEQAHATRIAAEREAAERVLAERMLAERAAAERAAAAQAEREALIAAEQAAARRRQAAERSLPPPPPQAVTEASTAQRVLVADDSKVVRIKTGRLLSQHGYQVGYAVDGLDALRQLQDEPPHLLITDVEMPGIDGFELTRHVRADARTAALPVIMITAADERHRAQAEAAGVSVLLGKPYADEALLRHIQHALGREAVVQPAAGDGQRDPRAAIAPH